MTALPIVPDNAAFRAMWDAGVPLDEIGQCYGVTRAAISKAAKRFGYPPRHAQAARRRQVPVPKVKPAAPVVRATERMPREEHRLILAHEHGELPALDLWPLERDMDLLRCHGRYTPMNVLAREWGMSYSRLLARWHLLRVL